MGYFINLIIWLIMLYQGPTAAELENQQYLPHIRHYASGQYLAHLAYFLADKQRCKKLPAEIKVLNEEGRLDQYSVKTFPLNPGLYAYLLLPNNKSNSDVKVIFRGTDFDEPESAAKNFEFMGPCVASFNQEKKKIFSVLKEAVTSHYEGYPPTVTLQVCGHSQGAALSQLFTAEFLQQRFSNHDFDCISEIHMTALNSPGVPNYIAKRANAFATALFVAQKGLKIVANYGMVGGDPVQTLGMNTILANLPCYIALVNLLKMDIGLEGSWLKDIDLKDGLDLLEAWSLLKNAAASFMGAHPTLNFYTSIDNEGRIRVPSKYQFWSNKNKKDIAEMQGELFNKARITQYLGIPIQMAIYCVYKLKSFENWLTGDTYLKRFCNRMYSGISGYFSSRAGKVKYALNPNGILSQAQAVVSDPYANLQYYLPLFGRKKINVHKSIGTPVQVPYVSKNMVCMPPMH